MTKDEKELKCYLDYVDVNTVNKIDGKSLNTRPQGL